MNNLLIVLLIIIILIFIYNLFKKKNIEGYDERFRGLNVWDCADFCKRTANCYGFAYNYEQGICYPSQKTLMGKPTDPSTLFSTSYSPNNMECNKSNPVIVPEVNPPFDIRRSNSIYLCKQKAHFQPQWYLHNRKGFRDIGEGKNIDEVFEIDKYNIKQYNWPINKFNMDQEDLLVDYLVNRFPNQYNVTNINKVSNIANRNIYLFENNPLANPNIEPFALNLRVHPHFNPKSEPNSDMNLDFGLDTVYNFRSNLIFDTADYLTRLNNYNIKVPTPNTNILLHNYIPDKTTHFIPYDDYNGGDYLNNYKCVDNITFRGCLDYCINNEECKGVEYNPQFGSYNNVCCPKRNIGQFYPRKWIHKNGKFYAKS